MKTKSLLILLLVFLFSGPARGQDIILKSDILGEERKIGLFLPANYDQSDKSFPVLYLLDGNTHFQHAVGAVTYLQSNGRMPGAIVVSIVNVDRNRDFSPVYDEQFPTSGGAEKFLGFISSELMPYLDENYRISGFNILMGHSFGGTFAAYALMAEPDAFDAYIAVSPYLQYSGNYMVKQALKELRPYEGNGKYWYMTVGNEPDYFEPLEAFSKTMKQKTEGTVEFDYVKAQTDDHMTIPYMSLYNGLRFIFRDWALPREKLAQGLEVIDAHYARVSMKYGYRMETPENVINLLGYTYLQSGEIKSAIEVFQENVKRFPGSANVYDSLGEAYENNSQQDLAENNYRRAWELGVKLDDPNTPVYKRNLERVQQ